MLAGAVTCAFVFGAGVPLLWVWVASHVQPSVGQATSGLAALIVIVGPLASYFALVMLVDRFTHPRDGAGRRQRVAWNRTRDEIREDARQTTPFEQVVLLAILLILLAFNVWFFAFAHQPPWGSG